MAKLIKAFADLSQVLFDVKIPDYRERKLVSEALHQLHVAVYEAINGQAE